MERVLSQDERIRRAEEIYAKRRMQNENRTSTTVNIENTSNNKLTKKLIVQFFICLILYVSFYVVKNSTNILSQDIMYKISDVLEYDINVQELYNNFSSYINKQQEQTTEAEGIQNIEDSNNQEMQQLVEETLSVTDNVDLNTNDTVVAEPTNAETQEIIEESSSMTQMEIDAEYIKANYSLIKPLEGEITSRYGIRNPTIATVPKYHTGIDIARVIGTVIISAMDGTVELVSSEGDLRKPC